MNEPREYLFVGGYANGKRMPASHSSLIVPVHMDGANECRIRGYTPSITKCVYHKRTLPNGTTYFTCVDCYAGRPFDPNHSRKMLDRSMGWKRPRILRSKQHA